MYRAWSLGLPMIGNHVEEKTEHEVEAWPIQGV